MMCQNQYDMNRFKGSFLGHGLDNRFMRNSYQAPISTDDVPISYKVNKKELFIFRIFGWGLTITYKVDK